jgi:thioredoxin 2
MPSYLILCPACGTENRIPAEKEGVIGRCGTCHNKLPALYLRPVTLTEKTFDSFFKGYEGLALAEFWAPW